MEGSDSLHKMEALTECYVHGGRKGNNTAGLGCWMTSRWSSRAALLEGLTDSWLLQQPWWKMAAVQHSAYGVNRAKWPIIVMRLDCSLGLHAFGGSLVRGVRCRGSIKPSHRCLLSLAPAEDLWEQ